MRAWLIVVASAFLALPAVRVAAVGPSGYLVGYAVQEGASVCTLGNHAPTIQTPLFKPYHRNHMQWWYNLVEEAAFSNVTFVALNFRGDSPCGVVPPPGEEPTFFASNLVSAINKRGYTGILKVALFDDTGSYQWHRATCTGNPNATFDLADTALRQSYFWDTRWRRFFERVPDANRMKIQGRPLVVMWSVHPGLGFINHQSNLGPLIQWLRNQSINSFGFNPFIVVDWTWIDNDPGVASVVDGVHNWFQVNGGNAWSLYTHWGASGPFTTGVVNPGFWAPQASMFRDRFSGFTLRNGLTNTGSADLLLLEGQTDIEENAGFYRGAKLCSPACGSPYTPPPGQCWSHANQYLNIVREAVWPFPRHVVFEAEASDSFSVTTGTTSLYRRDADLDIAYTDSSQSQWSVRLRPGNWLEFQSFQLGGAGNYRLNPRYSSTAPAIVAVYIDGVQKSVLQLPSTGGFGNYVSFNSSQLFSIVAGNRQVRFKVESGEIRIDHWTLTAL